MAEAGDRRRPEHALVQPDAGAGGAEGQAVPAADRVPPGDLLRGRSRRHRQDGLPRRRACRSTVRSRRATARGTPRARRSIRTIPRRRRRSSPASGSPIATATACSRTRRASRCSFPSSRRRGNIRERVATMIQEQLRPGGHQGRRRRARSAGDVRALRQGGLREHLLRLPGELVRSRDEPGLLAQRRLGARLELRRRRRRGRRRSTT